MLSLTLSLQFSSKHRLVSPWLNEAANLEVYGKCGRPGGHGHNYRVEVTVAGTPNPETGWILPRDDFEALIRSALEVEWDHRDLNDSLGGTFIPTGENLVGWIWRRLSQRLPAHVRLARVGLQETRKNSFAYYGEGESAQVLEDSPHSVGGSS